MPRYFHVDRTNSLVADQVLRLERHSDVDPPLLQAHVDEMLPDGVTTHGELHLLRSSSGLHVASPTLELVWELARRVHSPDAPSRY